MAPQPDPAMLQEIRRFFEQYRDAFNALDGEAVAKLYAVPSGIAQGAKYEHWPSFEPIKNNMVALCSRRDRYQYFRVAHFQRRGSYYTFALGRCYRCSRVECGRSPASAY
jgi:hypothetical protein